LLLLLLASDGVGGRCFVAVIHRLEPTGHLLEGQGREVQESLHRQGDMRVLLGDDTKVLLHCLLLINVTIVVSRQLLHQAGEAKSEVIDVLPWPKCEAVPLLA
jgi:hypothetical protein